MTKYHARKTEVDGITFASKLEADRYKQLRLMEQAGEIQDLRLQVQFQITKGMMFPDGEKVKSRFYVADFMYIDKYHNRWVVEDTKGVETPEFKLKWDYVKSEYPEYHFVKVTKDMI